MKMRLELDMDNAAFEGEEGRRAEIGRLLLELRHKVMQDWEFARLHTRHYLRDINGNTVGTVRFEED